MRSVLTAVLSLCLYVFVASTPASDAASPKALQIYFIDVEGGQATLVVSPVRRVVADRHRLARI